MCVHGAERGEEEGWSRRASPSLPTAAHTREEGSQIALSEWASPASSGLGRSESSLPSHLRPTVSGFQIRQAKNRQTQEEETLPTAHFQPLPHICDGRPPFTPLFPFRNSSRPPARRPSPTAADRSGLGRKKEKHQKTGPEATPSLETRPPHPGLVSFLRPLLTHQNAHLLLAEEAGEEGGDGEAHGGSGTCNGQEQKGFGASPGLLLLRSQKTQRVKSC